ncbi:MAG: hypothetical protein HQK79_22080 [Desulfobacterales bacterium]|nr:hypothetical protein [Desulfobacterales bacterium]
MVLIDKFNKEQVLVKLIFFVFIFICLGYLGCASSKIHIIKGPQTSRNIERIAVSMQSGVLGEALIRELNKQKFNVIDMVELYYLLERNSLKEIDVDDPKSLFKLYELNKIDTYIDSKTKFTITGHPENASIVVYNTRTGDISISLVWENGWGGAPGSPADYNAKKNTDEAATEIVGGIIKYLK